MDLFKKMISQGPGEDYGAVQTENQIVEITFTEYEKKKLDFLSKLKLTSDEIHALERRTVDQSSSDKRRRQSKMRLTASNFGKIAKLGTTTSRAITVKYILYELFSGNVATRLFIFLLNLSIINTST